MSGAASRLDYDVQVGDEVTVAPGQLVAGGAALARIDGFPIFAINLYPGDVARVRLTEVKKGFARAELLEVITPSALRRAAPCPVAEECGGCDWTAAGRLLWDLGPAFALAGLREAAGGPAPGGHSL